MNDDFLVGLGAVISGAGSFGLGLYTYLGPGAPDLYRRMNKNSFGLFGRAVVVFLMPAGLGITLMGVAFLVGKNTVTTNMLVAALGLIGIAWVVCFVHPRAILPTWMREGGHSQRKTRSGH